MNYVITTDSNSEIPFQLEDEVGIKVMRMPYSVNSNEYLYDLGREIDIPAFYQSMRDGATVTTAQKNPTEIIEYLEPFLMDGKDILHLCFSSALSGTFSCAVMAKEELSAKYPERRIELVDTLAIASAHGLLVERAYALQKEGKNIDEVRNDIEANKQKATAVFTVDSLEYLRRGGRVSGAAAFFGGMLDIKPILYINEEGKLVPLEKIKGRKKALRFIVEKCKATIDKPEEQTIVLMHADNLETANSVADMLRESIPVKDVRITHIGPVIGSHAGPGTIALAYFCTDRKDIRI